MAGFDAAKAWLAAHQWTFDSMTDVPELRTKELTRHLDQVPNDIMEEIGRYLRVTTDVKNGDTASMTVLNPTAARKRELETHQGTFRLAKLVREGETGWVQTLRLGYATTVSWPDAYVMASEAWTGNTESITAPGAGAPIANATSDNPCEFLLVRFPNVAVSALQTFIKALPATITAQTVGTTVTAGTFHKMVGASVRDDLGGGHVDVVYSKDKFVLNLFRNNGTTEEQAVGQLYNVPTTQAQTIADAWKASGVGRSASANVSRGPNTRYVDLTLTAPVGLGENLTTNWIQITGNRWRRWHFAWGYTEETITQFLANHNEAIGTLAGNAGETQRAIMFRNPPQTQLRGDGFFDGIIVEESWGPHAAIGTPDYTITIPIGTKITDQRLYWWDVKKSEIDAAAFKAVINTTIAAKGRTVSFRLIRDTDESFSIEASIVDAGIISASVSAVPAGSTGISDYDYAWDGVEYGDATFQAQLPVPEARRRVSVQVRNRQDEKQDVTAHVSVVQKVLKTLRLGTKYRYVERATGNNADAADLPSWSSTPGVGKTRTGSWHFADDGTVVFDLDEHNAVAKEVSVTTKSRFGAVGVTVVATVKENQTDEPTSDSGFTSLRRRDVHNLEKNDDGTFSYIDVVTTITLPSGPVIVRNSNVVDKRKTTIKSRVYFTGTLATKYEGIFLYWLHSQQRTITKQVTASFYGSYPTDGQMAVGSNQDKRVEEIFGGLIYVVYAATINYPEMSDGSVSAHRITWDTTP